MNNRYLSNKIRRPQVSGVTIKEEAIDNTIATKSMSNIINYMIKSYGGINNITSIILSTASNLPQFRGVKSLKYISNIISIGVVGYDFINKVISFTSTKSASTDRYSHTCAMLKVSEEDSYYSTDSEHEHIMDSLLSWLIESPNIEELDGISIVGYYTIDNKGIHDINPLESEEFYITIEDGSNRILIRVNKIEAFGQRTYVPSCVYASGYQQCGNMIDRITSLYIKTLNLKDNVISTTGTKTMIRPRTSKNSIDIEGIDYKKLTSDICMVLNNNNRRGYMLVGNPGTGKTTILLKIEEELRDYPIISVVASNMKTEDGIRSLNTFIQTVGKCIVFIEDMDALELSNKSDRFTSLLELFDGSKHTSSVVYIATINDAELINPSLVRSGRFDEIIDVKEPNNNGYIFRIMRTHHTKISNDPFVGTQHDISWLTYNFMKRKKFTNADYCEVIHKMILNGGKFSDKEIMKSAKSVLLSKNTYNKYYHKQKKSK